MLLKEEKPKWVKMKLNICNYGSDVLWAKINSASNNLNVKVFVPGRRGIPP